ncbi:ANK2 [Branchiostoma lanceolatum]|uniref:ANK2 protein n=1 Tax=Branchiostoma lanceolatum TaxID=7740 RepID=A0A8J9ZA34_BRALA|nr:ANK2 [Branchiostoma lanceolatum]
MPSDLPSQNDMPKNNYNPNQTFATWLGATSSEQLWDSIHHGNLPEVRRLARSRLIDLNKPFVLHQRDPAHSGREERHNPSFLLWACRTADVGIVEALVAAGADVDRCGYLPTRWGSDWQCSVWDAEKHSYTPLIYAVEQRNVDLVRKLIVSCAADPNATNIQHRAPLHFAARIELSKTSAGNKDCEKTREQIVDILLKAGARADLADRHGITPLHVAAEKLDVLVCKTLLQRKYSCTTNINAITKDGRTPLNSMLQFGLQIYDEEIAMITKMLVNRGASLHTGTRGYTPLHLATENGLSKTVQVLVHAGSDIQATTTKGLTSLDLAYRGNHWRVVRYLHRCVNGSMKSQDTSQSDPQAIHSSTAPGEQNLPPPQSILQSSLEKDKKKISILMTKIDDFLQQILTEKSKEKLSSIDVERDNWHQPEDKQQHRDQVFFRLPENKKHLDNDRRVKKKRVTFRL